MIFTTLGKLVSALCIIAAVGICAYLYNLLIRPGAPTLDLANPLLVPLFASASMAVFLFVFGILLGVFCEISSNLRRLKWTP